jgi:hypothetical protein
VEPNTTDQSPESSPPKHSSTPDDLRFHATVCVEELYRGFQEEEGQSQIIPKEEYSRRRAFLDELTKDIVRIAYIPDEEVEQSSDDYEGELRGALSFRLFELVMNTISSYDIPEDRQINLTLTWELATLIKHLNDFHPL